MIDPGYKRGVVNSSAALLDLLVQLPQLRRRGRLHKVAPHVAGGQNRCQRVAGRGQCPDRVDGLPPPRARRLPRHVLGPGLSRRRQPRLADLNQRLPAVAVGTERLEVLDRVGMFRSRRLCEKVALPRWVAQRNAMIQMPPHRQLLLALGALVILVEGDQSPGCLRSPFPLCKGHRR